MMRLKINVLFVLTGLSFFGISQVNISENCKTDILTIYKEFEDQDGKIFSETKNKYPINKIDNVYYLNLLFKIGNGFYLPQINQYGAISGGQSNDILSIKWPISEIEYLWNLDHVLIIQLAQKIKPELVRARGDTRVDSVHAGLGLNSPFTGKDVLIGITDWGFDYSSPMFYDTLLNNTRILAAWDQFKTSGPHPAGFNYGTEYSTPADLIAAGSDTANIYSFGTHGTHVAGIAGGSGAGTVRRGMAFESEYLMATFLVDEGAVLDAWQWMYNKSQAEGKRLVINMSWGLYHTGALDGTSLLSQALDNYSDLGVVFVTSAGNNGDVDFHIKYDFAADTMRTKINFYNSSTPNLWGQSIHAWGEPNESFDMKLRVFSSTNQFLGESPWYPTMTTLNYIDTFIVVGNDSVFYNLSADAAYPTNNRPQMRLRVKKVSAQYRAVLECTSSIGRVHFWNVTELSSDVGNWGMPFSSLGANYTAGDADYSIGAPACTETAITVAAHASEYYSLTGNVFGGTLANFSSRGPLMTEDIKPDISAPGVGVGSSISSYTDNSFTSISTVSFNGRTYPFAKFSGTSMSSPAVAGIAALVLEANPNLSSWQVKRILIETAREDNHTGVIAGVADNEWGWGKVNAYKAVKRAINTVGLLSVKTPLDWTIYPNPTQNVLKIMGLSNDVNSIQIINLNGQIVSEYQKTSSIDLQNLSSGFYIVRVLTANSSEQQTLIIE
ncbi:MAG: S8/S53 family peptidase [Crocinitomicaceae bacterium]